LGFLVATEDWRPDEQDSSFLQAMRCLM
jgi:hypothetical protein